MYRRPLLVVKIGGSLIPEYGSLEEENLERLGEDISRIYENSDLVVVHGGANRVSYRMRELGKEPEFVVSPSGFRSRRTDKETIEIFTQVMGEINKGLVNLLRRYDLDPTGFYGENSPIRATRKRPIVIIDGRKKRLNDDYTGRIKEVDRNYLVTYVQDGKIPIISPIAIGDEGELLNVDGDTAAAYVTSSLGVERLVDFTDVDGVLSDGRVVSNIDYDDLDYWIKRVQGGMKRKLLAAKKATEMGVDEFIIGSGTREGPLRRALDYEGCTVIR